MEMVMGKVSFGIIIAYAYLTIRDVDRQSQTPSNRRTESRGSHWDGRVAKVERGYLNRIPVVSA
jgi:hypothetical protein